MDNLLLVLLLILAFAGAVLSIWVFYVRMHLNRSSKDIARCFGVSCISVMDHSLFRFLGVPIDVWGIIYYVFLTASVVSVWVYGGIFWALLFLLACGGSLFSLYFILLQTLAIKAVCKPVLSALSFSLIFTGAFFVFAPVDVTELIRNISGEIYLLTKIFSVTGLILASASFLSFLLFMEDMRISSREAVKLSLFSEGVLLSALLLLVLGVALVFIADGVRVIQLISFSLGVTLVAVICEFVKTVRIRSALVFISLKKSEDKKEEKELLKRLAFGVEGIAVTSWIFITFLFLVIPEKSVYINQVAGLYILLVMIAFLLSQLVSSNILYGNDK
ncbi:MAG: vitamin K epoxide reductase family protein [Patescibacteria group bacterium]